MKDMIALTKTIRGIPGHESARIHVVDHDLDSDMVRKFWCVVVPVYRLSPDNAQRPTLDFANIKLVDNGERIAAETLCPEDYERMLHILISHVIRILGADCVPVVMKPVTTDELRNYIEPLTRLGKGDSIEFPAVKGDKPRFRLLGISDRDVRRRGWVREGEFGWVHIKEEV